MLIANVDFCTRRYGLEVDLLSRGTARGRKRHQRKRSREAQPHIENPAGLATGISIFSSGS